MAAFQRRKGSTRRTPEGGISGSAKPILKRGAAPPSARRRDNRWEDDGEGEGMIEDS